MKVNGGFAVMITACFLFIAPAAYPSTEAAYRLNESGLNKLNKRDFKGAIEDLKQAHIYLPANSDITKNLAVAYNNYAFHLMGENDFRQAIEKYESALYYDSDNPYTLYNLGQAYYRTQNMPKARDALEKAYKIMPRLKGLKDLLKKVASETDTEGDFEKTESTHFIIASAPDMKVDKFSYIRTYLEEAYGKIGMFLDYFPESKCAVILYSESNYGKLLGNRPHWTMAVFDGKVRIPAGKFKYSNDEVVKIIYHEYAHAVVRNIAGGNCPLWLNEGIASRAEDFAMPKDRELIKGYLLKYGLITVNEIPDNFTDIKDPRIATLLYIQSYLLVTYIIDRAGQSGLRKILDCLGRGMNISYAIYSVLGDSYSDFGKKWADYVSRAYGISGLKYGSFRQGG
ncbi:MAG: tetratricopeptide repeat protein [Candidatus Omnitrophota bacterium]